MSDTTQHAEKASRFAGWRDELMGTVKERMGRLMKKQEMERDGKLRREKGQREVAAAKAKKSGDHVADVTESEGYRGEREVPVLDSHRY